MGAWNIITRQSGLDLLGAIADPQLNRADIRDSIREERLAHAQSVRQCQRRCDFVVFRRTGYVEKWRVMVYSLCIIILAVFVRQA